MIKVSTISTSTKGGAGIAAYRLHKSLNLSNDVKSIFINAFEKDIDQRIFQEHQNVNVGQPNFFGKIIRKINHIFLPEYKHIHTLSDKYKYKLSKLNLKCEIASVLHSKYAIEENIEVKNADIIHLHWISDLINYPTFFKSIKQPIVWTLHDMNPFQGLFHYKNDEGNNPQSSLLNKKFIEDKIKYIKKHNNLHIVCLTDWMLEASKNSDILGSYPHYLIPNGLDFTLFNNQLSKTELKTKFSIDNDYKTLLFVSQDIKNIRKGFDLLSNALKLITNHKFNVITVGNNHVELPKNFNHIHFKHIDDINKLNELYSLADLFILPSREDNLPNVMLESWANGTPIISFNTGGMKDWVIPNQNGILIDDFSINSFAEELINFAADKYTFDPKFIRNYAKQNFNQIEQTKKYIKLYQSILK